MGDSVGGNSRMLARTRTRKYDFFVLVEQQLYRGGGKWLEPTLPHADWRAFYWCSWLVFTFLHRHAGGGATSFPSTCPPFFLFSFTAHLVVSSICASVSGATPPGYDFYYRWEMSWAEPTDDTKKHRSSDELLLVLRICLKNVRAFQFASFFFLFFSSLFFSAQHRCWLIFYAHRGLQGGVGFKIYLRF